MKKTEKAYDLYVSEFCSEINVCEEESQEKCGGLDVHIYREIVK